MSYTGVFLTLKRKPLIVLNSRCLPLPVLFRNSNPYRFCWTILSWKWAMMFFTLWPPSPSAGQRVQGWVDKGVNSYWSLEEKHLNLRVGTPCSLSSWPPTRELEDKNSYLAPPKPGGDTCRWCPWEDHQFMTITPKHVAASYRPWPQPPCSS